MQEIKKIQRYLENLLRPLGIELVHPFLREWYDSQVNPKFRFASSYPVGFLFANTKNIWSGFVAQLKKDPTWVEQEHPFDRFVEDCIENSLKNFPYKFELRFAHKPDPQHIRFQQLGHLSGFAFLAPSHLSVHREWGPWFSFRAALLVDIPGHLAVPPALESPCPDCQSDCLPIFETMKDRPVVENWRDWLAIREACPIGQEHRFDSLQLEYHYTHNKDLLRNL